MSHLKGHLNAAVSGASLCRAGAGKGAEQRAMTSIHPGRESLPPSPGSLILLLFSRWNLEWGSKCWNISTMDRGTSNSLIDHRRAGEDHFCAGIGGIKAGTFWGTGTVLTTENSCQAKLWRQEVHRTQGATVSVLVSGHCHPQGSSCSHNITISSGQMAEMSSVTLRVTQDSRDSICDAWVPAPVLRNAGQRPRATATGSAQGAAR